MLEMYGVEPISIRPAHIRAGNLGNRFDVIILVDFRANTLIAGRPAGSIPGRYAGGIGREGVRNMESFVREGGTLVCLNNSSLFAIDEFHLPVENIVGGLDRTEFFLSGSILELELDPYHPVMSGMESRSKVFAGRGPVFTVTDEFEGTVLAKYQADGSPLVSGYLLGEKHLNGYAAALDVEHGDGHVILLGFRPQWRGQTFNNFKILMNSALFHGQVAAEVEGSHDFWKAPATEAEEEGEEQGSEGRPPGQ